MLKRRLFSIAVLLMLILLIGTILTALHSPVNNTLSNNISGIDNEYKKNIKVSGVIYQLNGNGENEEKYIFVDEFDRTFNINQKVNKKSMNIIEEYLNYRIIMEGRYRTEYFRNDRGDIIEKYHLVIDEAEIKYQDIDIIGKLSLRGSPPKLILKTEDDNISYEIDKSQEIYQELIKEYQGYKVKIVGKYYSFIYMRKDTKIERRYLIIDKIEIL
jgi:hypothetical protein